MSILDPRLWLAAIAMCLACFFAGGWRESSASVAKMKLTDDAARIELANATERVRETERLLSQNLPTINDARTKEQENAKNAIDSLRADVRTGSVAARTRNPAASGADSANGNPEDRAELLPATADAILDIAVDADSAVRDLNACIDRYDARRRAINP